MENQEYEIMFVNENEHWWYKTLHNLTLRYLKKYIKHPEQSQILDAGCGTGRLLELLTKNNYNCEGFDFNETAINFCKSRNLKNISKQDLNAIELKENYYDAIISNDVLYHKTIINESEIITKFYKALKKNGILIMNLPAFEILKSTHDKFVHNRKRYILKDCKNLFKNTGFKIELLSYRLLWLFFPVLIYRLIKKIFFNNSTETSDVKKSSPLINNLLFLLSKIDNFLFLSFSYLPVGTSVYIIVKK